MFTFASRLSLGCVADALAVALLISSISVRMLSCFVTETESKMEAEIR